MTLNPRLPSDGDHSYTESKNMEAGIWETRTGSERKFSEKTPDSHMLFRHKGTSTLADCALSPACPASTFPSSESQKFVSPLFVLMGAQVFPESSRIWRSSETAAKSRTLECAQLLGNRTIIAPLCSFLCCCFKRKNGGGMKFTVSMKKQEKYFHAQGKT